MAEALAAFSVAANVLQFVDIGTRTLSTFWSFYRSNRKGIQQAPDIVSILTDLQRVLEKFQLPPGDCTDEDAGLVQLARECQDVALEMQSLLHSLFNAETKSMGKRDALLAAFKMMCKEEKLRSLQDRLNQFRHQLVVHLLASLRFVDLPWAFFEQMDLNPK
jgi:hypothetical protein